MLYQNMLQRGIQNNFWGKKKKKKKCFQFFFFFLSKFHSPALVTHCSARAGRAGLWGEPCTNVLHKLNFIDLYEHTFFLRINLIYEGLCKPFSMFYKNKMYRIILYDKQNTLWDYMYHISLGTQNRV